MSVAGAFGIGAAAALPTTLAVLALTVLRAGVAGHERADAVLLPYIFLMVPLVFFVSLASNLFAVALGQGVALAVPGHAHYVTTLCAGAAVVLASLWTQRGTFVRGRPAAPLDPVAIALFAATDMAILAGGLALAGATSF